MPKLFVGSSLANFDEPRIFEQPDHLVRFQYRRSGHISPNTDRTSAHEFRNQFWLAIFEEHFDDFL